MSKQRTVCLVAGLCVGICLLVATWYYLSSSRTPELIFKDYSPSIVTIYSRWEDIPGSGAGSTSLHGTGFIVSTDGYIATAGHIVRRRTDGAGGPCRVASGVYVTTCSTGKVYRARVVCIDGRADVALLKIDASGLCACVLRAATTICAGAPVMIIGNAFGIDALSMSTGVVRNPRWKDPSTRMMLTSILTTVPTSNGVSGAPILDGSGQVVGIHTAAMHPPRLEDDEESEDSRLSTVFGGGLSGPILARILHRCISHDRGDCLIPMYRQGTYMLTKKCILPFTVVPNVIQSRLERLPQESMDTLGNKGYIITSMTDAATLDQRGPRVGDVITSVNGHSVGLGMNDASIGDCAWFADEGDHLALEVYRCSAATVERLQMTCVVSYLPTVLDIAARNDPQFAMLAVALLTTVAVVYTAASVAMVGVVSDHLRPQAASEYCSDIKILKPSQYVPGYTLEDPSYDPLLHDRGMFDATTYYLRRLSVSEISAQRFPGMIYEVMQDLQLSCLIRGRREVVTVEAGHVFNGDSLKLRLNLENDGIAWVFHDWLYNVQAFDVRVDGTQTVIQRQDRWVADELMYELIKLDGYVGYSRLTRTLDLFIGAILNTAWDAHGPTGYMSPTENR